MTFAWSVEDPKTALILYSWDSIEVKSLFFSELVIVLTDHRFSGPPRACETTRDGVNSRGDARDCRHARWTPATRRVDQSQMKPSRSSRNVYLVCGCCSGSLTRNAKNVRIRVVRTGN